MKWMIASVLFFSVLTLLAYNPPKAVLAAFKLHFPEAKGVEWNPTGEKKKAFHAAFSLGKHSMNAYYDAQGMLAETDADMDTDSLPGPVIAYLDRTYEKYKVKEARSISRDSSICCYEMLVKAAGLTSTIVVSKDGLFMNR